MIGIKHIVPWRHIALRVKRKRAHYGYPLKLRIPTKLGFKNPKWITAIFVTNRFPGGFWEDRGYSWFAGRMLLSGHFSAAAADGAGDHHYVRI